MTNWFGFWRGLSKHMCNKCKCNECTPHHKAIEVANINERQENVGDRGAACGLRNLRTNSDYMKDT